MLRWAEGVVLDKGVSENFVLEIVEIVLGRKPTAQDRQDLRELRKIAREQ